jgi:hypothetical protein
MSNSTKVILLKSMTVHRLRSMGLKVLVIHQREYTRTNNETRLNPKGGITSLSIVSPYARDLSINVNATCHPREHYDKKIGVQMCLSRINQSVLNGLILAHRNAIKQQVRMIEVWEDNPIY